MQYFSSRFKFILNALLLLLLLTVLLIPGRLWAKERVSIAVIADASIANGPRQTLFIQELESLVQGELKLIFPNDKQYSGLWSPMELSRSITQLQKDKDIDIVLALGWLASQQAIQIPADKPTFAPTIFNKAFLDLSLTKRSPQQKSSGIKNLNYLASDALLIDELRAFQKVVPFKRLAILIDQTFYESIPGLDQYTQTQAQQLDVSLQFILHNDSNSDLLALIGEDIQAVMIAPLPLLGAAETNTLIKGLQSKGLPSYSWKSRSDVEAGIYMSNHSEAYWQRLARRNALNMQAVLRGERAESQTIAFNENPRFRVNMTTARAIGAPPCYDVIDTVQLIADDPTVDCTSLELRTVAKTAIEANLGIIAGKLGVEASDTNIVEARSLLFPKITANLSHVLTNDDHPFVEIGFNPESRSQASLRLEQVLFSEQALANLAIQKHLRINEKAQQRTLELDVVKNATAGFFNILIAQTQYDILKNNLELTQAHLELAKNRVSNGVANLAEVYRWESEIASNRQLVLKSKAAYEQASDVLNLILHFPIDERYALQAVGIDDPELLIGQKALLNLITNEKDFAKMSQFFVQEGLLNAPEITAIDAQMDAQERQIRSEKRRYWTPNVALFGEVSEVFEEDMKRSQMGLQVSLEDITTWQAGVSVSLPLFEGGSRHASLKRSQLNLRQLQLKHELTQQGAAQEIRARLHAIQASYPAIRLSEQAAEAARKSYEIVKENYINGTLTLTDLLDAQTASLTAKQAAANAVHAFLIDLMQFQRSIGQFDFFLEEAQRQDTAQRLRNFIQSGGSSTNTDALTGN